MMLSVCTILTRTNATSEISVWVDPPTQTVEVVGTEFNVTLRIDNMPLLDTTNGVFGVEFFLTWNPAVLTAVNMTEVLFHSTTPETEIDNIWPIKHIINNTGGEILGFNVSAYIWYAYTYYDQDRAISGGYAPITGNHTLAIITFNATKIGLTDISFFRLAIGDSNGQPLPTIGTKGTVTVGNPPPSITIISPQNTTYGEKPVNLTFATSEPTSWIGYSLNEAANVTITGNTTISPPDGWHNLVVYANDTTGQMGSSDKLYFTLDTTPPVVSFTYSPETPVAKLVFGNYKWEVLFNASASYDSLTQIVRYVWDFGDGSNVTSTAQTVTHVYRQPETYNVTLKAIDTAGNLATQTKTITIAPVSEPLTIPFGLVAIIVIPVVWIIALGTYLFKKKKA